MISEFDNRFFGRIIEQMRAHRPGAAEQAMRLFNISARKLEQLGTSRSEIERALELELRRRSRLLQNGEIREYAQIAAGLRSAGWESDEIGLMPTEWIAYRRAWAQYLTSELTTQPRRGDEALVVLGQLRTYGLVLERDDDLIDLCELTRKACVTELAELVETWRASETALREHLAMNIHRDWLFGFWDAPVRVDLNAAGLTDDDIAGICESVDRDMELQIGQHAETFYTDVGVSSICDLEVEQ